jgi:hypothetical protein
MMCFLDGFVLALIPFAWVILRWFGIKKKCCNHICNKKI